MTTVYHRNLPHIHPAGATFFVTFRLAGSLPPEVVEQLRSEFDEEERRLKMKLSGPPFLVESYKIQKKFFGRYGDCLDQMAHGPIYLRDPEVAQMVMQEIRRLDGTNYALLVCCIMPNHVHLLVDISRFDEGDTHGHPSALSQTLHLLKGRTARYANQHLGCTGKFWQDESYDHFVRDNAELRRIMEYILHNPVKAGLVKDWQDWPYSYVAQD